MGEARRRLAELNDTGSHALLQSRAREAVALFEEAVVRLRPADDDVAADLYENLGLAYLQSQRSLPALRAFLRALDGEPTRRAQSLRFVVPCLVNERRFEDAARYLTLYEGAFGPHPDGWTSEALAQLRAALR